MTNGLSFIVNVSVLTGYDVNNETQLFMRQKRVERDEDEARQQEDERPAALRVDGDT